MNLTTAKKLNNGVMMPIFGLGVYKSGDETYDAVRAALDAGYRHIDTAALYKTKMPSVRQSKTVKFREKKFL